MTIKLTLAALAATFTMSAGAAHAVTTFNIAEGALPGDLGVLQAERAVWASSVTGGLTSEGLEGLAVGSSFDFGAFSVSIGVGDLTAFSNNSLVISEGSDALGFNSNNTITFAFDDAISAFAIDWTSIDQSTSNIAYSDNGGGSNNDLFDIDAFAGAGFMGVVNTDGFTEITFAVTSNETLLFDNIQFGGAIAAVPLPAGLPLLVGALGFLGLARRKAA